MGIAGEGATQSSQGAFFQGAVTDTGTANVATLTATLTSSGSGNHASRRSVAAVLTSTGALIHRATLARVLSGVLTSTGVIVRGRLLAATVGFTGTATKTTRVPFAATWTSVGSLGRGMRRLLMSVATFGSGGVFPSLGTFPSSLFGAPNDTSLAMLLSRGLTGSVSLGASIRRSVGMPLTGTLHFVGGLSRAMGYRIAAALSFAGGFAHVTARQLAGALSLGGLALTRGVARGANASLSFAGSITRRPLVSLAALLSPTGGLARASSRTLVATLTSGGSLGRGIRRAVAGALHFSGSVNSPAQKVRVLTASLNFTALTRRVMGRPFIAALSTVGGFGRASASRLLSTLTFGDGGLFPAGMVFPGPLFGTPGDTSLAALLIRGLDAALNLSGSPRRATSHLLASSLPLASATTSVTARSLRAALATIGSMLTPRQRTQLLAASLTSRGTLKRNLGVSLTTVLSLVGGLDVRAPFRLGVDLVLSLVSRLRQVFSSDTVLTITSEEILSTSSVPEAFAIMEDEYLVTTLVPAMSAVATDPPGAPGDTLIVMEDANQNLTLFTSESTLTISLPGSST